MANHQDAALDTLEQQANSARQLLYARTAKRPFIIEFSGTPNSGKTTAINILSLFFRRNGFKVETLADCASTCPLDNKKGHPDFNIWLSCESLQGIIESVGKDLDLLFVDRGIFDDLVWNTFLTNTGRITAAEARAFADFFTLDRWTRLIDLVCVMKCAPSVSIDREYANQLTRKRGTIMEENTLAELNASIDQTLDTQQDRFKKIISVSTTATSTRDGASLILNEILAALRDSLDESLCVLRSSKLLIQLPEAGFIHDSNAAQAFLDNVVSSKEFVPRHKAELDPNCLIPIPCALLIFDDKILLLTRQEEATPSHSKYAVWAGGHIQESDEDGVDIFVRCIRRELMEELDLQDLYDLRLIGIVRTDQDKRDQDKRAWRHIGVVYIAQLKNERVVLSLHQKEFRETYGTSVTARFVEFSRLNEYLAEMGDWSKFIVAKLWPEHLAHDSAVQGKKH